MGWVVLSAKYWLTYWIRYSLVVIDTKPRGLARVVKRIYRCRRPYAGFDSAIRGGAGCKHGKRDEVGIKIHNKTAAHVHQ